MAYLSDTKYVTVDREDIVQTVLHAYRSDLELEHHKLHMDVSGERRP